MFVIIKRTSNGELDMIQNVLIWQLSQTSVVN